MEIIKLYYPLLFIIIPLLFAFRIKHSNKTEYPIPINFGGVLNYSITIKSKLLYRVLISVSFIPSLAYYSVYDYSALFPKYLTMQVFYDKQGILENLKQYSSDELKSMHIDTNFLVRDTVYFRSLDQEINKFSAISNFFSSPDVFKHSEGKTSFIVEKIGTFQRYQIKESAGEVVHQLDRPENTPLNVKSYFEKINSRNDYLELSLFDLVKGYIILKPLFKETIADNNKLDGARFNHILCGLTKVRVFPLPTFSNTIYLLQHGNQYIPVGYAIYK